MDRLRDCSRRYPEHFGALAVDAQVHARSVLLDGGVDRDDVVGLRKGLPDLQGESLAASFVGAIDLSHERAHDRRPRGDFDDFDPCIVSLGDLLDFGAQALRDRVALFAAMVLIHQSHLQVAELRLCAQVVLANQPIEGDRACRSGVALQVAHLGLAREELPEVVQRGGGIFERRACRHIDDHLELALVVEGQHLKHDPLHHRQANRKHERDEDAGQEQPSLACAGQKRIQHARKQARKPRRFRGRLGGGSGGMGSVGLHQPERKPGCDRKGDRQRDRHAEA